MDDILAQLRKRVAKAPKDPGIYRWKNKEGDVLYVGKAKNLQNRLKSYVQKDAGKNQGPWKQSFLRQIADFDVTVTNSELEALVLETNLIKEIRPKYNVLMKDDKHYVYVEVTVQDSYPTVALQRRMIDSKAKYFGPFLSSWETKQTLEMLNEIFHFRACKESLNALNKASVTLRPCLDHQIGRCCGTCAGVITQEEYRARIDQVMHFFKGDYKSVLDQGMTLMKAAALEKKFERAARLRDMLRIIEGLQERQLVSDTSGENVDVIGVALLSGKAHAVLMRKRNGKLIGEEQFALMGSAESVSDVLDQLLPQYYDAAADIPDTVIVGEAISDAATFEAFLSHIKGRKVKVLIPERGHKSHLLQLAEKNAEQKAKQAEATWEAESRNIEAALTELRDTLSLPDLPARIEGYDISHSAGTETVGSMVVFVNGKAKNEHYRNFTIHTMVRGVIDDYRSLREVLTRRLRHLTNALEREKAEWEKQGVTVVKGQKADVKVVQSIVTDRLHAEWSEKPVMKEWMLAKHEGQIVACVQLVEEKASAELRNVWVDESYASGALIACLIRTLLHSRKKGNVYTVIDPAHEQAYGSLGFRHVLKTPAFLADRVRDDCMCMLFDPLQNKTDTSLATKPDLLVIDGGKGQLSTVVEVLKNLQLDIPVIGLAKREEEVFVPNNPVSILMPHDSQAKFMLMRLRDEAHRFANRHRSSRVLKAAVRSELDSIPGISIDTQRELLTKFGSVDTIKKSSDEALREVLSDAQIAALRERL